MPKLIMTKGLPASGKSTWAKEQLKLDRNMKRVNKDDLRAMLDDGKWSKHNEKFVLDIRDTIIRRALCSEASIIVDDTNLAPKHASKLGSLAAECGAIFEIKDFTTVPLDVCIERDKKRQNSVGEKVIKDMYYQYLWKKPEPIKYNKRLDDVIICDIDGTLAEHNRGPFEFEKLGTDSLIVPVAKLLDFTAYQGYSTDPRTILMSGREEKYREPTVKWLSENHIDYMDLFMRATGDTRSDTIVKQELYEEHIKGKYNVLFVIDDRKRVKRMWVEQGLFVFDVNQYDLEF